MPSSLSETLDRLSKESAALTTAAWANDAPSGPFTTAYLNPSVFTLVRDSDSSEQQPFRRLLDDHYSYLTAGPSNPAPESSSRAASTSQAPQHQQQHRRRPPQRPEQLLTPLRELPRMRNTPQELGATLNAVEDIISSLNDSYSLKRARNEVRDLAWRHESQRERMAELERLIAEESRPRSRPSREASRSPSPTPEPESDAAPQMSVEEAIAAEEEALKALDASLEQLRREHTALRNIAEGRRSTSPMTRMASPTKTPTKPKAHIPVVTNSLVSGPSADMRTSMTPRQAPLSTSIFGRQRPTMTPARLGPLAAFGTPGFATTPRAPRLEQATPVAAPLRSSSAAPETVPPAPSSVHGASPSPTPIAAPVSLPPSSPPAPAPPTPAALAEPAIRMVDGVEIDHPGIPDIIDLLWTGLAMMMKTGTKGGEILRTPEATLAHLVALSRRDPDPSVTPAITTDTILIAHMVLMLLRGVRTGRELSDTAIPLPELKADLGAVARARAWTGPEDIANKIIYHGVGLKVATIVRRENGRPCKPKIRLVFPNM